MDANWYQCIQVTLVELIRAKKQWAPAIFSTAILLGTNIPWVGQKKNLHGDISLNLHNLCKNTKIFLKNIILLKTNVLLDKNFPWRKPKRLKKESDT